MTSVWRDVLGVDTTLDKKEWQYFLETRNERSEWQVMRFSWFGDYNHASTFSNIFRSGDPQNLSRYSSEKYDQLLGEAASERHDGRRTNLMIRAESNLLEGHPVAPLYFYVSKHLVSSGVAGFKENVLDRHPSQYFSLGKKK